MSMPSASTFFPMDKESQKVRHLVEYMLLVGDDELEELRHGPLASPITGLPLINYEPVR